VTGSHHGVSRNASALRPIDALGAATFVLAPVGAVLGHLASGQISRKGQRGRGMARAAITVGWVVTIEAITNKTTTGTVRRIERREGRGATRSRGIPSGTNATVREMRRTASMSCPRR
jgi:hypothetical protein